jgi:hypothetical protein
MRIVRLGFGTARQKRDRKGSLNDGQIQNPSNPFGIVPLSNFVPRGFGFVHHSIAILYHEVPLPYLTIRELLHRSTTPRCPVAARTSSWRRRCGGMTCSGGCSCWWAARTCSGSSETSRRRRSRSLTSWGRRRTGSPRNKRYKPIALIDQLNRQGDFAILSTAKTKIALSRFKGLRALTDGLNRDT